LRAAGHHVVPFALRYARNEPTEAAEYFPPAPAGEDFVLFGDHELGSAGKLRLAAKVLRDRRVYQAARRVLREQRIDVVYALQIAHYLDPDLLRAARDAGVPVVMRLSDYQLVCPAYNCLRDGQPCFACREGLVPALVHRCLKKSLPITAVRVAAMTLARATNAHATVKRYVSPSRHLLEVLKEARFAADALTHLPTPLALPPDPGPAPTDGPLLYVGGLYEAKGAHLAVAAVAGTGRRLLVAGDTETPYARALKRRVQEERISEVEFLGFASGERLARLYGESHAVLVPSLWWENIPHVALEAMAYRRPVIATGHGSLPEIVRDGKTGLLFAPGDAADLRRVIESLARSGMADQLGQNGRAIIAAEHDPELHVARLERVLAEARA
jgi:glycosyltransferase involved in cell wall biosynthesis